MASTLAAPAPRRATTRDHRTIAAPPDGATTRQPLPMPPGSDVNVAAREDTGPPAPEMRPAHETTARAYGERAAHLAEWLPLGWDVVSSLLAAGWSVAHEMSCGCAQDWRLSLPLVKGGWIAARAR